MAYIDDQPPRGAHSHGLIGSIADATKRGWYLTPWGWLKSPRAHEYNLLSFDRTNLIKLSTHPKWPIRSLIINPRTAIHGMRYGWLVNEGLPKSPSTRGWK